MLTGHDALRARDDLRKVSAELTTLREELASGDQPAAARTLRLTQAHARSARDHTHGLGWWLGSKIPTLGRNVTAVRTVSDVSYAVTQRVLPDLVEASGSLNATRLRPVHGRVDLQPIRRAAPELTHANRELGIQVGRAQTIATGDLAPQIAGPVRTLQTKLVAAQVLTDRSARAAQLLPPMLGADGPRRYLLIFQNNAEARSAGGIPGSLALVRADRGKVRIIRQGDATTIGRFAHSPTPLHHDELSLFGKNLGRYIQDTTFTPDFPRTGQLVQAMWRARQGTKVDGVMSVDPVALSMLLRGTGPVPTTHGGQLTAGDAVYTLLSKVYAAIPQPSQQNVFFNAVARNIFDAVASGQGRPLEVLRQLGVAAGEHRLLMWSDRPEEQRLIAPTAIGGMLPRTPTVAPQMGVFLNDAGASKLDYYLHYRVDAVQQSCSSRRQVVRVTMRMRSSVPHDPTSLPAYVRNNLPPSPPGLIRLNMFTYAPIGGRIARFSVDGRSTLAQQRTHDGRTAILQRITLRPGARHVMVWDMVSGPGQTGKPQLRVTPGVNGPGVGSVQGSAC